MADLATCELALNLNETSLSGLANVVGLGIVDDSVTEGAHEGDVADNHGSMGARTSMSVAVYVEKILPKSELCAKDVIPKHLVVGADSAGDATVVDVRVIEIGNLRLE